MANFKRLFIMLLMSLSVVLLIGCGDLSLNNAKLELNAEKTTIGIGEQITIEPKVVVGTQQVNLPGGIEYRSSNEAVLTVSESGVVEGVSVGNATVTATVMYENVELEDELEFSVKSIPLAPTNLKIEDGVLTWTAVSGATGYVVQVNGMDNNVTMTSFDLKTLTLAYGNHEVKVFSKVGTESSTASTITYVHANPEVEADIYEAILGFINEGYLPDMEETDFEDDYEYQNYLRVSRIARAYTNGALLSELSLGETEEIIGTFLEVNETEPESVEEIKEQLDKFRDLDIDPDKLAKVLVEVMLELLELLVEEQEQSILDMEDEIAYLESQLAEFKTSENYVNLMNDLEEYATEADLQAILDFTSDASFEYFDFRFIIINVQYDLNNEESYSVDWYRSYEDPMVDAVLNIVLAAYENEDEMFIDNFSYDVWLLEEAHHRASNIDSVERNIVSREIDIENLKHVKEITSENKEAFYTSLSETINFVYNFYDNLDNTLVELLDNLVASENVTPEEIFILKDEVVDLLMESLPTASEFENMYLALFVVMYDFFDINPNDMVGFSTVLGQMENLGLTLMLNVLDDIDLTMYNEVFELVTTMHTPGYWDNETEEYVYPVTDPKKVVEFVVYVGDFYYEVKETHALTIAALDALNTTTFESQLENIFSKVLNELPFEDNNEVVLMLWENYLENKDTYKAVHAMMKKYGDAVFSKFVETNGKLALDFITFIENGQENEDLSLLAEDFRDIFEQLMEYHALTIEDLTDPEIDSLVEFILLNAKFALFNFQMEDPGFEEFLDSVTPQIKQLVKMVIEIEIDLAQALKDNDAAYELLNLAGEYSFEEALAIQAILAFDVVLTTANEQKFTDGLDILFDEVFTKSFFLEMNEMTEEDLEGMRENFDDLFSTMFEGIRRLADYDFSDLLEEEYDDFVEFMGMLFGGPEEEFE